VREITGRDEIGFRDGAGAGSRLAGLLAALGERGVGELRVLGLPDWEETLLALHVHLFGAQIEAELTCPHCGAGVLVAFDARELPRGAAPVPRAPLALGALRLGDILDLEKSTARGEAALAFLLARSAEIGVDEAGMLLAGTDRAAFESALEALAAGLAIELGTSCADCAAPIAAPFDIAVFLDSEIGARSARLLDEVHLLASSYHWSEAEILGLPSSRRQAYLSRVLADRSREARAIGVAA
jgi:hypothetical protein